MEYDFDFYPDCVKGVLPLNERAEILKDFIQSKDSEYILALYDKMHSRVTDLRIEQEKNRLLEIGTECNKKTISDLSNKLMLADNKIKALSESIKNLESNHEKKRTDKITK